MCESFWACSDADGRVLVVSRAADAGDEEPECAVPAAKGRGVGVGVEVEVEARAARGAPREQVLGRRR